mmetsp:Transcript_29768/g.81607  ORF Transcript_29768/g.81607 Transcript_29768/m.81607 type:complete len:246 (-) Transcript_29768:2164-2901(-)
MGVGNAVTKSSIGPHFRHRSHCRRPELVSNPRRGLELLRLRHRLPRPPRERRLRRSASRRGRHATTGGGGSTSASRQGAAGSWRRTRRHGALERSWRRPRRRARRRPTLWRCRTPRSACVRRATTTSSRWTSARGQVAAKAWSDGALWNRRPGRAFAAARSNIAGRRRSRGPGGGHISWHANVLSDGRRRVLPNARARRRVRPSRGTLGVPTYWFPEQGGEAVLDTGFRGVGAATAAATTRRVPR